MIKFFKYLILGMAALVGIGVGLAVLGLAVGMAILAFKIGIVVLVGYGVVKLFTLGRTASEPQLSEADRRWLES